MKLVIPNILIWRTLILKEDQDAVAFVSKNFFTKRINFVEFIPSLLPWKAADAYKEQIFLQSASVILNILPQIL
jgi:hypothetical protein